MSAQSACGGTAVVARLDSTGDVLITGPAVRAVAEAHERVVFLTGSRGRAAAELLPGVDEVLEWQAPWVDFDSPALTAGHVDSLVKQLADLHAERALIFTSHHQSPLPMALLFRMSDIAWVGAISEDYPGSLLNLRHHVPAGVPEPERALSLARAAGYTPADDDHGLLAVRHPPLPLRLSRMLPAAPYVVFHPGAAVPARRPSADRSAAFVTALVQAGHRVVVTGGPDEGELTAAVAGVRAEDFGAATSLAELAAIFAQAAVVVAPNTGPAHLAAAVGTPVVSLFSPVVPAEQWLPSGVPVIAVGDQNAPCRGTRTRTCSVPGHPCLDSISAADVVAAVEHLKDVR